MFYVGQKVRVVNVTDDPGHITITPRMKDMTGEVLTIKEVSIYNSRNIYAGNFWWNYGVNVVPVELAGVDVL